MPTPVAEKTLTIALAGNPNSGKTTIFNGLTGLRQKVANYPGVTVEKKTGRFRLPNGDWVNVIDLPGTYSLISRSPDETVAMEVLRGLRGDTPVPDIVICVVDASNLQRNLYLVSQLIELGRPLVIALNMVDVAERRGIRLSADRLSKQLGVPVVPIVGHQQKGINHLKAAVKLASIAPMPIWPLPEPMKVEMHSIAQELNGLRQAATKSRIDSQENDDSHGTDDESVSLLFPLAERLLINDHAGDLDELRSHRPLSDVVDTAQSRLQHLGIDAMQADIEAHYHWIDEIAAGSLTPACEALFDGELPEQQGQGPRAEGRAEVGISRGPQPSTLDPSSRPPTPGPRPTLDYAAKATLTDRIDHILLHKVFGLAIFAVIMAGLFVSIFWLADPIMGGVESGIALAGDFIARFLPDGPLKDLWTDGIVAGVGGVLVFVPQIALLFLFLAILEDSGYLARAAFLMDRVLSKVGLHGKSFIPLLSSFACAIPGIMAARTIECRRDRLATIFVAPFMSCSARLPVYALLIGAFFAQYSAAARGGILLSLYALGIIAAFATALFFKFGAKREAATSFILELPSYKRPQVSQVARVVVTNTWAFVSKAGTIIFCLSVILWAMMYYPRLGNSAIEQVHADVESRFGSMSSHDARTTLELAGDLGFGDVGSRGCVVTPEKWEVAKGERIEGEVSSAQLRHSYAGRLGHFIEPAIKPLGYDWKMGIGLISAFAAREVFVSTMGIVYSVGNDDENVQPLESAMQSDRYTDGRPVWTPLVAMSLLVWFVLAMQCMSTVAIVRRETGSWKWPIIQLVYMTGLAYVVSLGVYQVGKIWFA